MFVSVLAAMWWQSSTGDAAEPTPAPVSMTDGSMFAADTCRTHDAAPVEAATPAPAPKLVGTVISGSDSLALVRPTAGAQLLQLHVGDQLEDLVVTAIKPDRVVLAGSGRSAVIEIETPLPAASVPALPPPPPPPTYYVEPEIVVEGH